MADMMKSARMQLKKKKNKANTIMQHRYYTKASVKDYQNIWLQVRI
jgi:hypothetical protein